VSETVTKQLPFFETKLKVYFYVNVPQK